MCLKLEKLVGIPPGADFWQRMQITHEMVKAACAHVAHINLTDENWELIRQKIAENERKRPREIHTGCKVKCWDSVRARYSNAVLRVTVTL